MADAFRNSRGVWLVVGVMIGLAAGALLPQAPLHAVATDRIDNFAIATGPLDPEMEAVYFLDCLTGDLRAASLNLYSWKFTSYFQTNVIRDLGVDVSKNPRYLLVTGNAIFRPNAGPITPAMSAVYVAEITSGRVAAYAIPWSEAYNNTGIPIRGPMALLDVMRFRTIPVRDQ